MRYLPVYPRVCGGTIRSVLPDVFAEGLSPRVRGNLEQRQPDAAQGRSIPACAGEPMKKIVMKKTTRVYPRVCGGTLDTPATLFLSKGLSPRVRGNP